MYDPEVSCYQRYIKIFDLYLWEIEQYSTDMNYESLQLILFYIYTKISCHLIKENSLRDKVTKNDTITISDISNES